MGWQIHPLHPLILILDANTLIANYAFNSHKMRDLLKFAKRTNSYICLHEIDINEVRAYIERNFSGYITKINRNLKELRNWRAITVEDLNDDELTKIALDKFENDISNLTISSYHHPESPVISPNVIIAPTDTSDHEEATRRLIQRIPPSTKKGEEYRDVIIWLNMLRFCIDRFNGSPIAFISEDKHFINDNKKLKSELMDDIRRYQIDFEYVGSLAEFLENYSSPIGNIERYWIISRLDIEHIKKLILGHNFLQNFNYHNNVGQKIDLDYDAWTIKLESFNLFEQGVCQKINLTLKVIIRNSITIEEKRGSNVRNIRVGLVGNIIDEKLSIENLNSFRFEAI